MAVSIKSVWIAVKTTPWWLWGVAAAAVCFVAAKILYFNTRPEIFPRAYEIGQEFQIIAEATVAAVVFFVISFQLPAVIEQQRMAPVILFVIENISSNIRGSYQVLYRGLDGNYHKEIDPSSVTLELVEELFKNINPIGFSLNGRLLPTGGPVPWRSVILDSNRICNEYINNLWRYVRFIDSELALLMSRLEYSEYALHIQALAQLDGIAIGSFEYLSGGFYKRFCVAGELSEYADRLRSRYGITSKSFIE